MKGWIAAGSVAALAALATGCGSGKALTVERTTSGPTSTEIFLARSFEANGREPNFDEKSIFTDRLDERVFKYLREHPEIQNEDRYSNFRFWHRVSQGSPPGEVRVLLDEPDERTIDPALMAALASHQWTAISAKAKEAWVYPLNWIIYFDDKGVVEMVRRRSQWDKGADD